MKLRWRCISVIPEKCKDCETNLKKKINFKNLDLLFQDAASVGIFGKKIFFFSKS